MIQEFYCANTREYTNIPSCSGKPVFDSSRQQEGIFVYTLVKLYNKASLLLPHCPKYSNSEIFNKVMLSSVQDLGLSSHTNCFRDGSTHKLFFKVQNLMNWRWTLWGLTDLANCFKWVFSVHSIVDRTVTLSFLTGCW